MLRKLNKRAQSTAEYAIVIAIVVGALVAMQIYVRRGLQGRIRNVVDTGANISYGAGTALSGNLAVEFTGEQFEPYYLATGSITQTATGNRTQTGSTETNIVRGETNYATDRTGARTSGYGMTNIQESQD